VRKVWIHENRYSQRGGGNPPAGGKEKACWAFPAALILRRRCFVHKPSAGKLTCVFCDNGVLRAGEAERVIKMFKKNLQINCGLPGREKIFLKKLKGVTDPEKKPRYRSNFY
jgi:hypothetical protein